MLTPLVEAQQPPTCQPTVYIDNQLRRLTGEVMVECGNECVIIFGLRICHSAPFGNWGVDSTFSRKTNKDQFRGWFPEHGHGQWNSCTEDYTDEDEHTNDGYKRQKADPDDEQVGGWKPLRRGRPWRTCENYVPEVYSVEDIEMALFELDKPGSNDYVTTLEYGDFDVVITCSDPWTCDGAASWRTQHSVDETGVTTQIGPGMAQTGIVLRMGS